MAALSMRLTRYVLAVGCVLWSIAASAGDWSITDLGQGNFPFAINNAGQIVGQAGAGTYPFSYPNPQPLDFSSTTFTAINNGGQVAGFDQSGPTTTAFYRSGTEVGAVRTDLGSLGGTDTRPNGINDARQIVGGSGTRAGDYHAFLYQNGKMTDLGTLGGHSSSAADINNAGQIVGEADTAGGDYHAFLYQNGKMTDLGTLGGRFSGAASINEAGQIVGGAGTAEGEFHAFLYENGKMKDLGVPRVPSYARGINNAGQIVGDSGTGRFGSYPFIYQDGNVTVLGIVGGASLNSASGINDLGQVIGFGYWFSTYIDFGGFLLTPVPQTAPWAMLLAGWGALAAAARRRRINSSRMRRLF